MNKISVEMFCKLYKTQSKGHDKTFTDFLKKHITTEYIEFLKKDVICDGIIKATSYVKDGEREFVKINSSLRYLFFVMKLIELYTDIDIDGEHIAEQYDELNKIGAVAMLLGGIPDSHVEFIPESEYAEFSTILNMKLDDLRDNEYSTTALVYNLKNSVQLSEEVINSALERVINDKEAVEE